MKIGIAATLMILMTTLEASEHKAITLLQRDNSFAAYKPWDATKMDMIKFRFKTYLEDCFLLHIDNKMRTSPSPTSLQLTIRNGRLRAVLNMMNNSGMPKGTEEVSSNLNDNNWHWVVIDSSLNGIYIQVDNIKRKLTDKSIKLSSPVYIGGMKSVTFLPRFKGCIDSLLYKKKSGEEMIPALIEKRGAYSGCINSCQQNTCQNDGKCINMFTTTACDCKGTGYEGPICTKVAEVVFLHEADYVRVNFSSKSILAENFFLSMRLRTRIADGLLLAVDELEKGFNVAIIDGSIKLAVNKLVFTIGNGMLHDSEWHHLTVGISNGIVKATLDARFNESRKITEENKIFMFPLYIGGIPKNILSRGSLISSDFSGCLQQLYINEVNIIYRAFYMTKDKRISATNDLLAECPIESENKSKTQPGLPTQKAIGKERKKEENADTRHDSGHSKILASNNKDMIAWIISGVVSGVIVIMIITACAINYFKFKYEGIFLSRGTQQESCQHQLNGSVIHMHSKQYGLTFSPQKQMSQAVSL